MKTVFYREQNSDVTHSTPLIFVHGAGSSHLTWPAELRRLRGWRTIALDLPGHGKSGDIGQSSVVAYAEDVRQLMDELDIPQAYLVGHSMGGAIVQTIAAYMNDRVKGLLLIGTGGRLRVNPTLFDMALHDLPAMADLLNKWMWGEGDFDNLKRLTKRQTVALNPQVVHDDYLACEIFDLRDRLPSIRQPVLIIGGTADKMTPYKLSEEMYALYPNSTLHQIEGAGHMLHLEHSAEVGHLVEQWLNRQEN